MISNSSFSPAVAEETDDEEEILVDDRNVEPVFCC